MITRKAKLLKMMKIVFIINLNTFGSKVILTLKIMDFFLQCAFNKSYSCLCDRGHECIIYMIQNQFVVKIYVYLKCNVEGCTLKTIFQVIKQHKNNTCHVQSLERDFYLGAPGFVDCVFTHGCVKKNMENLCKAHAKASQLKIKLSLPICIPKSLEGKSIYVIIIHNYFSNTGDILQLDIQ